MISIDDFKKIEIKIGEIMSAERIPETDKLLKLGVNFGEAEQRLIISGIAEYYASESLVGKKCAFVANLEPRTIRGLESNGMILAVSDGETFSLLTPDQKIIPGSTIR
ncbi:MAG: methionine--tRNA ligase subunit beta [bacterium]|nr:methionine--tRNA ligase subunit beta [bacterium]